MNIPHELSLIIRRSHSLSEILESAVRLVAREMNMDACSIYLIDPRDQRLHLRATEGLDKAAVGKVSLALGEGLTGRVVAEMRSLAVEDASTHPSFLYFPETREERFKSFLGVPLAIRNRPVGAIVVQTCERRAYSEEEIQTLNAIAAQLVGVVENARIIEALDRGEEGVRYLEEVRRWRSTLRAEEAGSAQADLTLEGSAASSGIAIGRAVIRGAYDLGFSARDDSYRGEEVEKRRVAEALEKTRNEILKIQHAAEHEADEEHALIFSSHLLLLNDPVVLDLINRAIEKGATAPVAVFSALEEFGGRLENLSDPYIRQRVEDIRDLQSRILGQLVQPDSRTPRLADRIVVSKGLPPSLVVELKAEGALALITEGGGPTSHGALLARSMAIPAVTGLGPAIGTIRADDLLIVDGRKGLVIVNPSPRTLKEYEKLKEDLERRRTEYAKYRDRPLETRDGVRVPVLANIGVTADIAKAVENGAEGVGLYRTEFPFLIREQFPTRAEQVRIYSRAYEAFPEGPINFRILDLGADKILPSETLDADRDPFGGYRSIRVLFDHPEVLREQVQAFALAAQGRPLSILVPMVASIEDLRRVRKLCSEALEAVERPLETVRLGVMIELPAAVHIAGDLAEECDYLSIGTNDLIQYALAIDRSDSRVASPLDSYHPGVLRMIRRVVEAAHAAGKPVSVCGEMASRPPLALLLVAMGVDNLSVTPSAVPELKRAFAGAAVLPLRERLDELLSIKEAKEIARRLRRALSDTGSARPRRAAASEADSVV